MKTITSIFVFSLVAIGVNGQILNPALSDAVLLPKGNFEITVGYSALGLVYDGESEGLLNSLDFQLGYGISQKVNIKARYQKAWYAKEMFEESAANFLYVGPEFQLMEGRVSFFLPMGTRFIPDADDSYYELTPTFNFTLRLGKKVFFNPALELGFEFCEYCSDDPYLGIDLGLGVRPNDLITIFGEYDLVYSFEDFGEGHYNMINAGIAFQIPGRSTKASQE